MRNFSNVAALLTYLNVAILGFDIPQQADFRSTRLEVFCKNGVLKKF